MSAVVGIDLSSHAIDLVRLDETDNQARWDRIPLSGKTPFERLRSVEMPSSSWWDNVYLCAIEMPESRFRSSLRAQLPVFGAVVAHIPSQVETWAVAPAEWKPPLGVANQAKPTTDSFPGFSLLTSASTIWPQDALDALGVAYYARETNARGIAA